MIECLYPLNLAYLPLFEQAPPFLKLVALIILTPIVMPIVTCRGSVQKKFELMEIALGDYNIIALVKHISHTITSYRVSSP